MTVKACTFASIEKDDETKKVQRIIRDGMESSTARLEEYVGTWGIYKEIWEINKDAFIRRYQKLDPPVPSFDSDTAR